jgi:pyruvate,water dikinase
MEIQAGLKPPSAGSSCLFSFTLSFVISRKPEMGSLRDLFSKEKSCRPLVNLKGKIAERYRHYRDFLIHNHEALSIISDIEFTYHGGDPFTFAQVKRQFRGLIKATRNLVTSLDRLSGGKYKNLIVACDHIEKEIFPILEMEPSRPSSAVVLPFEELTPESANIAGTKATNLALLASVLGLPVPRGFVITANAFDRFLDENGLWEPIEEMLASLPTDALKAIEAPTKAIREQIRRAPVPPSLAQEILMAYEILESKTRKNVPIAMRSTAVGEDTEASFAGQYLTVLNAGRDDILDAYRTVLASKYAPRAILCRLRYGLEDRATPMCVAGIEMIDARASGVMYTADPLRDRGAEVVINAILGLGEYLVSGATSPDLYYVNRETAEIIKKEIHRKDKRLVPAAGGGTRMEAIPENEQDQPAISDDTARTLAQCGAKIEAHFGMAQDVEWAVDLIGHLYILQARPLHIPSQKPAEKPDDASLAEHPILLSRGSTASRGIAVGRVCIYASAREDASVPEDAILVTRTASPAYAKLVGRVKGIITDIGSVASHLASVAREFGVPALFNTGQATTTLPEGQWVTLVADRATVYSGQVPTLDYSVRPSADALFESPKSQRMRAFLDRVSPLHLTDPKAPSFSPENCRTFHDIIRFAHEKVVKEMFGLVDDAREALKSVRMTASIPLQFYFIDLSGGLKSKLTTCDTITPEAIESVPMKALWRGLSHPGVTWSGTINVSAKSMMALMTSGPPPAVDSYAILSDEYLNLSIKFGYHYANIDVLCGKDADQNHITLQFAGGAGSYYGRTMRINFLAEVLHRLGFTLSVSGDLLEGSLRGFDMKAMEETLDQLGRLLASSRLLDLAIPGQAEVSNMTEKFFEGDYDFLQSAESPLPEFYTPIGHWDRVSRNGRSLCLQDGSKWGDPFSCGLNIVMGKMIGSKYQQFLERIQAYHYFPIAIAKKRAVSNGSLQVRIMAESGCLDRAGGLAFAVKNAGNYFVLALNALQDRVTLFQFMNNRPVKRVAHDRKIESGEWYLVRVEIVGHRMSGYMNDELVIEYDGESPLEGYVGLWTKADSKTFFDGLAIKEGAKEHLIPF